jgi:hypothetical protein
MSRESQTLWSRPTILGPSNTCRHTAAASLPVPAVHINFFTAELAAKRLGLLRELLPAATRVAVLANPADPIRLETIVREVKTAAGAKQTVAAFRRPELDRNVLAHNVTAFAKALMERGQAARRIDDVESYHRHRRLLRVRRERPRGSAAEQGDKFAAFHCPVPPVLRTERIAHLGTAGDCCAAGFRSGL